MILLGAWGVGLCDCALDRHEAFNFYAAAAAKSGGSEPQQFKSDFRAQYRRPVVSKG